MSLYRSPGHDINPSFTNFVRKIDQEIIWNFGVIRLLNPVSAHNLIIHLISFEELSYVDCQNVAQYTIKTSQYIFWINPIHEPIPGHQLFLLWQNAVSNLYIFDHQRVDISLDSMLEPSTRRSKVDHCEIWSFVKCGFLSSSCISQWWARWRLKSPDSPLFTQPFIRVQIK